MSAKKEPEVRAVPLCGSVNQHTLDAIVLEASKRGITKGALAGEILIEWAKDKPRFSVEDPNQMKLEVG